MVNYYAENKHSNMINNPQKTVKMYIFQRLQYFVRHLKKVSIYHLIKVTICLLYKQHIFEKNDFKIRLTKNNNFN